MFFLFALFLVVILISPKPKLPNATPGKLSDISFPRAEEGSPIPRIYGTVKFKAPNTIWAGDFYPRPITQRVSTGLFSHKTQIIGYDYLVGLDLAVCMGPGFTFRRMWAGSYEIWNGCLTECENVININLPNLFGGKDKGGGFVGQVALYCGSFDQSQDPYLQSHIFGGDGETNQVPAYNGTAHAVFRQCNMGNSTSIKPIYIEGSCFFDTLGLNGLHIMPNGFDMNPVSILHHIFVEEWGNLGVNPDQINVEQWKQAAVTIFNEANGSSLIVSSAAQASDAVKEIMSQINATMFQDPSTGLYDLILLRDDVPIDQLPVLGPDEIASISDFNKALWSQTYNTLRIKFTDRTQNYKEDVAALAQDFANIRFKSKIVAQEVPMQACFDPVVANMLAARELSNVNVPLYLATLNMNRIGVAFTPGSRFVLNWPEYGIVAMVMRVRKLGLGTLADGKVSMNVIQDVFSVADAVIAPPVPSPYVPADTSPAAIVASDVFELPYWLEYNAKLSLLDGQQAVAVFAKAPTSYSIGFNGYVVGIPDALVLDRSPYNKTAKLVDTLGQFDGFDTGVLPTLTITAVTNVAILSNGNGKAGNGLFMLNDEIMSFDTFTDNGDGTFTLNNVYRALFDTVYTAAATTDAIYFFDGQEGFLADGFAVGVEFDLKLADVSPSGEFAAPATIAVTPIGRAACPLPPDGLEIGGMRAADGQAMVGATVTLSWAPRNRLTAGTGVVIETDPADAPEAGTLYRVAVTKGAATLATADDLADTTHDIVIDNTMIGDVLLKVWAKRDGLLSFNPAIYPLHVLGAITIDGDRVVIDGNGILI